jgi:hypothetical protein
MKLLFDQRIPLPLGNHLPHHDVGTAYLKGKKTEGMRPLLFACQLSPARNAIRGRASGTPRRVAAGRG